jgi:hypothetical protein
MSIIVGILVVMLTVTARTGAVMRGVRRDAEHTPPAAGE